MEIHDHFDGSAHCLECKGNCKLTGDDRNVTNLIRWTFEFAESAHGGWMWDFTKDSLKSLLGLNRFDGFASRARKMNKRKVGS